MAIKTVIALSVCLVVRYTKIVIFFVEVIQNGISPVTPRMNLTCPNSQWPVFKSLQLKGCEVLAHFLGSQPADFELPNHRFTLGKYGLNILARRPPKMTMERAAIEAPDKPVHVFMTKIVTASILFQDVLTKFCIVSVTLAVLR